MIIFFGLIFMPTCKAKYEYPFQNPDLTIEERVENLLSLLTLEEKTGMMVNASKPLPRLGIPAYDWWNEAVLKGNRGRYHGLTFWTPNINIDRDPRWGIGGIQRYGGPPIAGRSMTSMSPSITDSPPPR